MSKHLQKLFALVLVCCAFLGSSNAWGQVFSENFVYPAASKLTDNGWSAHSGAGTNPISVVGTSLSYPQSPVSGIGGAASLTTTGEDVNKTFTASSSGSVYVSLLVNVSAAQATGDYFLNLGPDPISTTYTGRVFIKSSGSGIQFGISKVSTPAAVYGTTTYNLNETHLLVVKYTFNGGTTSDDVVELFVNPTLGADQPSASVTAAVGGTDAVAIGSVALRQGSGTNAPTLLVDGIQIGTTWASVTSGTTPTTTPTLTPSTGSLNFGEKLIGTAVTSSYSLSAENIPADGNVVLTTSGPFTISTSETGTFANTLTLTAADLNSAKTIYVKTTPATTGEIAGEIIHATAGATDAKVGLIVFGASPFAQNFNRCIDGLPGGWMQYSVTGAQTWACTTFGQQGNAVQMSGFGNSTNNPNQDWLISPKMDLTGHAIPLVSMSYRTKFAGNALKIMVSTNYSGTGDPATATWTELTSLPADEEDTWRLLENLGLQNHKSVATYIAFVYTSTDQSAARWTLDNFEVTNVESYLSTSHLTFNFPETAAGSTTSAQEFTFSAVGYTADVVVSAPANFELSKDGTTFARTLTYTSAEAAASNKVYVRFAPATTSFISSGPVSFTSGSVAAITRGMLTGSSLLKANTLEVVTWNVEWFGSTSNGPSDEALQFENAKKVITELNADIIGVQEIVDEAKMHQLATETGYAYVSETMSWQASNEQKVGYLYKPSTVTVKKEKVLLSKLFSDIKAGTTNLSDYPTNDELFWASGRLPYLVQFEATINGVKQTLNVVNLHAKANGENSTQDYERRKYDAKVLKDSLDAHYNTANLIILGDFNDDVDVSVIGTNQKSSFDVFVADNANYKTLTYDLSLAGKNTYESGSLKSFLDHIFISNEMFDEYVENTTAIEEGLLSLIPNFRTNTSDHLPVSARFILTADPVAPSTVTFTTASVSKAEDAGKFNVSLTLSAAVATEQTVTIAPMAGATASTADYTITGGTNGGVTVTIPANATTATFEINIIDDTETEAAEQVVFNITSVSSGLEIGTAKTFTLTIEANDAPKPSVTFTSASISKAENAGKFNVSLSVSQAVATAQTVSIAPMAGATASAADYTLTGASNGILTVTIPANATTATFEVGIVDDTETEAAEQVTFEISNPSSGIQVGTAKTFTLTIEANDAPTGIADGTKGQFSVYPTLIKDSNVRLLLPERVAATAKVTMVVYSSEGRKVLTTNGTQDAVQAKLNSKLASLPSGVYMILVETGKEYFQTKMVKN